MEYQRSGICPHQNFPVSYLWNILVRVSVALLEQLNMNRGVRFDISAMGIGIVVVSSCLLRLAVADKSNSPSLRQRYLQTRLCRCVETDEVYYASDDWRNELDWGFTSSSPQQGSSAATPQIDAFVIDQATNLVIVDGITVLPSNHTTCAARTNREQFMDALVSMASGFKALFSFGDHGTQSTTTTNESSDAATTNVNYWVDTITPREEFVVSPCPPDIPPSVPTNTSIASESLPPAVQVQYEPSTTPPASSTADSLIHTVSSLINSYSVHH